jgi:dienelactone hydrolase
VTVRLFDDVLRNLMYWAGQALVAAWETGEEMPFIFDTVWDIIKLMDYLTTRPDIDPKHIGMMGISLGGLLCPRFSMHLH